MENRRWFFRNYSIVFAVWLAFSWLSIQNHWTDIGWCFFVSSLSVGLLVLLAGTRSYNRPQDYPRQQVLYWLETILFSGGLAFFAVGYLLRALSLFGVIPAIHFGTILVFVGAVMYFPSLYLIPFLQRQTARPQNDLNLWDTGNESDGGFEDASSPSRLPPFVPTRSAHAAKSLPRQDSNQP